MSSILERKVRGWLSGVIDDMRRSSPVQQWLDSLPTDATNAGDTFTVTTVDDNEENNEGKTEETVNSDTKSDENRVDESVTENTVVETRYEANKEENVNENGDENDEKTLDVPTPREAWKRKSLESSVFPSTPHVRNVKNKLQRDHSIQSEGCSPRFKNPLFRDHSLQVHVY